MGKYTVSVDIPELMVGTPVEVPPIGVVDNGSSKEVVMEDEHAAWVANAYGVTVVGAGGAVPKQDFETVPVLPAMPPVEEVVEAAPEPVVELAPPVEEGGEPE